MSNFEKERRYFHIDKSIKKTTKSHKQMKTEGANSSLSTAGRSARSLTPMFKFLVMMHKSLKITRKHQAFKAGKNKPLHSQSHRLMRRKQAGKLMYATKDTMTISYS
jgi:hypothetical protein